MTVGTARKPRSRAAHLGPERRRPQILDAALNMTLTAGIQAVSIESVAQRLKVTRPVIYACFKSRDDLLVALLDREEQRLFSGVMSALPAVTTLHNPERLLIEGFQALLEVVSRNLDSWKLVFAASPDPAVADRFARSRKAVAEKVSTLMRPALLLTGTKDAPRKLPVLVEMFMTAGEGAVRALSQNDGQWTPEALGEFVGRIVYGALRKA